jgi:hypothetical protein
MGRDYPACAACRGRGSRNANLFFGFFAGWRGLGDRLDFDNLGYVTDQRFHGADFENGALFATDCNGDGA